MSWPDLNIQLSDIHYINDLGLEQQMINLQIQLNTQILYYTDSRQDQRATLSAEVECTDSVLILVMVKDQHFELKQSTLILGRSSNAYIINPVIFIIYFKTNIGKPYNNKALTKYIISFYVS